LLALSNKPGDRGELLKLLDRYTTDRRPPPHKEDRSLALIAVSFVEQHLEDVLLLACIPEFDEPANRQAFFGGDKAGAIDGFAGKIALGYALGGYTKAFRRDLDTLRHIRNVFAHCKSYCDFTTPEIEAVCDFAMVEALFNGLRKNSMATARGRFVDAAFIAWLTFELMIKDNGGHRPEPYDDDRILP